jgi:hypothetical protein
MKSDEGVTGAIEVPQIPGCLPQGYDNNSLLSPEQFAKWQGWSLRTTRRKWPLLPGRVFHGQRGQRIHVGTYLAEAVKN